MKCLPIITLDGPAGVGKSTLAKRLATILGIPYLDTGAMFRTIALRLGPGAEALPEDELRARCKAFRFKLQGGGEHSVLLCNGVPVGPEIRTEEVGRLASRLATSTVVRDCLKEAQRSLGESGLVAEGRDMGTVVFPTARFKFFLDARPEVRGMRRFEELQAKGEPADLAQITEMIRQRDDMDRNRAVAPLKPAADAVIVDTSDLGIEGVLKVLTDTVAASSERIVREVRYCPKDAAEGAVSGMRDAAFSHMAGDGSISMVDVGSKNITRRVAIVRGAVEMNAHTLGLLKEHALPKGDVLVTAQVAGIMAAKRTSELIPLCHPVPLSFVDVRFEIQDEPPAVLIESEARTSDRTGVEMEAIIAAQVAAATIYDTVQGRSEGYGYPRRAACAQIRGAHGHVRAPRVLRGADLIMLAYPNISPVALSLGPVQVHWYGLMYLFAFLAGWGLARWRASRPAWIAAGWNGQKVDDLLTWIMLGVVAGGRLGYVLFYDLPVYLDQPSEDFQDLERRHVVSRRPHRRIADGLVVEPPQQEEVHGRGGLRRSSRSAGTLLWAHREFHQRRALGRGYGWPLGDGVSYGRPAARAILRSCTRPGLKVWSCSSSCGSIRPGSVPPGAFPACSRCCTACSVLPWSLSASQIPSSAIWLSAGSRWGSFCVFLCLSRGSGCCSGL